MIIQRIGENTVWKETMRKRHRIETKARSRE